MKKIGDILLIAGGGLLFVIPATHLMRWSGINGWGAPVWIFAGVSAAVVGLLAHANQGATVRSIGGKIIDGYKAIAILTLNALILFFGLELTANVVFKARNILSAPPARVPEPREKSSYYASQPWALQYWDEFAQSRKQQYLPYVLWRRAPFQGKTINVDQDGLRLTPGAECAADSFKVFTFGSSIMWGTGAPDWETIPSYLQASLKKLKGRPVCVTNFGESAYVSTQSVVALLLQLQSGSVPNWVVFYHGPDDIGVAYESGRSDLHTNFDPLAARFEKREPKPPPFIEVIKSSHLFRFADSLVSKLSREPQASPKLVTYESMGIDALALSESIVQRYLSNYKIVAALAHDYGFEYFFFWPPYVSVGDKHLTSEEETIKLRVDPSFLKLLHPVYQAIERVAPQYKDIYYMGKLFDEYQALIWIDDFHVTPAGNKIIAEKMLEIIMGNSAPERTKKNYKTSSRYSSLYPKAATHRE